MDEELIAGTIVLRGHGGDPLPTYVARPLGSGPFPAIVMLHHRDGWDAGSKEIARRLAASGVVCLLPHLHHRNAPGQPPETAAAVAREAGGIPDDQCVDDAGAVLDHARVQPFGDGRVGVLGYCSGGRQAFLAAAALPFDTAIICYGSRINPAKHRRSPMTPVPALERAGGIRGSVFALFGEHDPIASPDDAAEIGAELERLGVDHRIRVYPGAGHAFFATDRDTYHVEAANAGWQDVLDWIRARLT